MDKYQVYIDRIKRESGSVDFDQMYDRITRRGKNIFIPAVATLTAAAVAAFVVSFYLFQPAAYDDPILNYMSEAESINGSQLISYVFQ